MDKNNEELRALLEEQNRLLAEVIHTSKVTNVLLLGWARGVDVTKPLDAQTIIRYLSVTDSTVRNYVGD